MRYQEFYNSFKCFTIFALNDIRSVEPGFHRPRLIEWQKKGYIKKLTRGYYIFADVQVDEGVLFQISNKIYAPSYVSLQMAFAYYGLIPESVYGVTAVATRRTYQFKTPLAQFVYRTIKPEMFFGYDLIKHGDKYFKMASPEKTFIDHLYLNASISEPQDFEGMRINRKSFHKRIDKRRIQEYARLSGQHGLSERVKLLLEYMKHA
jgi:predicted transcriptional regulator of viral defense system